MKKSIKTVAFAAVAITALSLSSCGKYEEGPGFTVLTKKARLAGEWDIKEYVDGDNGSVTTDSNSETFIIDKDGTYTLKSGNVSYSGTWTFTSNKERIQSTISYFGIATINEYIILRLTNKELWWKDPNSGDIIKSEKI